jgi:hypothetical protein
MRLSFYRVNDDAIVCEKVREVQLTDDMFCRLDYDFVLEKEPVNESSETLANKLHEAQDSYTVTVEAINMHEVVERTIVRCKATGDKMFQVGRRVLNDVAVDHSNQKSTFPRYCMRVCKTQNGQFYVKTAGFDQNHDLFLPINCTVLPNGEYSTSNPVWYVPTEYVHNPISIGAYVDYIKRPYNNKAISVSGNYYSWTMLGYVKDTQTSHYISDGSTFVCGKFVMVFNE